MMPSIQRITTYQFPETYQTGNWLMFNIYVHEESKFNEPETQRYDPAFQYSVAEPRNTEEEQSALDNLKSDHTRWVIGNVQQNRHLKIDTVIGVYLPAGISFDYNVNWGAQELGTLRTIMNAAGEARKGLMAGAADDGDPASESGKDLLSRIGGASKDASFIALRKASASLGHLVGIPLENAFDKHQKKTLNNHTELHFSGVSLRTFSFTFKFYPKTVQEAIQIDKIIKVFKFHMFPELSKESIGTYMLYPAEFDIQFMRGWDVKDPQSNTMRVASSRNKNVAKIARCALTNCKITHGEDEYVPIKGPNFENDPNDWYNSLTQMELLFTELVQLTKKDIVEGY